MTLGPVRCVTSVMEETHLFHLRQKLGITGDTSVAIVHPPKGSRWTCPMVHTDFVACARSRHRSRILPLDEGDRGARYRTLAAITYPSRSLWISWPKKSSTIDTDLSDHAVRHMSCLLRSTQSLCRGDTYTALRFVVAGGTRISTLLISRVRNVL